MKLREVAKAAIVIMELHEEAAEADAGFDAGEFSDAAHARMETSEITALALLNGFTYEDVMGEIVAMAYEPCRHGVEGGTFCPAFESEPTTKEEKL